MTQVSILLVEDEALIRMMLVDMVEQLGHRVIAEAGSVDQGRSLAELEEYDLAILDINLHGINVRPVAEMVTKRGRPLLFVTGYGPQGVPNGFAGTPVIAKPSLSDALKRTIDAVLSIEEPKRQTIDKAGSRR